MIHNDFDRKYAHQVLKERKGGIDTASDASHTEFVAVELFLTAMGLHANQRKGAAVIAQTYCELFDLDRDEMSAQAAFLVAQAREAESKPLKTLVRLPSREPVAVVMTPDQARILENADRLLASLTNQEQAA